MQRDGVRFVAATVPENIAGQSEMRTRFTPTEMLRASLASADNLR